MESSREVRTFSQEVAFISTAASTKERGYRGTKSLLFLPRDVSGGGQKEAQEKSRAEVSKGGKGSAGSDKCPQRRTAILAIVRKCRFTMIFLDRVYRNGRRLIACTLKTHPVSHFRRIVRDVLSPHSPFRFAFPRAWG